MFLSRHFSAVLFTFLTVAVLAAELSGQPRCLSNDDVKRVLQSVSSPSVIPDKKKLRKELLAMRDELQKVDSRIAFDLEKNQSLIPESKSIAEKHMLRVCQIVRENGWLTKDSIGDDGVAALTDLIRNNELYTEQRELLPVLIEAANKGYIAKSIVASSIDSIRLALGSPQIFGTQARIRNGIIYLLPLLDEAKVEEWRKAYDLPSLAVEIRNLEDRYAMPLLRVPLPRALAMNGKTNDISGLGISTDESEPVKVETKIVNLNVRIVTRDFKANVMLGVRPIDADIRGEPTSG